MEVGLAVRQRLWGDVKSRKKTLNYIVCFIWAFLCILLANYMINSNLVDYETNDDMYLAIITNGFLGKNYPYTMHNNILIGFLLAGLNFLFRRHSWTVIFYLTAIFLSYTVFGIWSIRTKGIMKGLLLNVIFVSSTVISLVCRMNFSKSGAVCFAVGMILLAASINSDHWRSKSNMLIRCIAYIMILAGSLVRFQTTLAMLPFFAVLLIHFFYKYGRLDIRRLFPFGAICIAIILCWCVDYAFYHLDEEWDYCKKYSHVRAELLDYGMPSYEAHREAYAELGLSEHDYAVLTSMIFADRDVYSLETMEGLWEIIKHERKEPINYQRIKSIIVNLINLSKNYIVFYVLIFLFFISAKNNSPTVFPFTLASLLLGIGEVCYLIYSGRYPERAIMIPILGAITVIAYFIGTQNQTKLSAVSETVLLCLVALYSYYALGVADITEMERSIRTEYDTVSSLFSELSDRQENLYVWDIETSSNTLFPAYGPFDDFEYGAHSNSVFMGGWLVPSPIMADRSEPFGEKNNLFKLLAENENVYFITMGEYQCELIRQYISEHYNPEVKYKLVDSINDYTIYSFASP